MAVALEYGFVWTCLECGEVNPYRGEWGRVHGGWFIPPPSSVICRECFAVEEAEEPGCPGDECEDAEPGVSDDLWGMDEGCDE